MLFEDEATKLKNNIKAKDAALRGSLTFFDSVCQESSTAVPLLTVAENHVRKSLLLPASQMPASILRRLSQSLVNLRGELLSLLEYPVLDSAMLPKLKQTSAKRTDAPATVE